MNSPGNLDGMFPGLRQFHTCFGSISPGPCSLTVNDRKDRPSGPCPPSAFLLPQLRPPFSALLPSLKSLRRGGEGGVEGVPCFFPPLPRLQLTPPEHMAPAGQCPCRPHPFLLCPRSFQERVDTLDVALIQLHHAYARGSGQSADVLEESGCFPRLTQQSPLLISCLCSPPFPFSASFTAMLCEGGCGQRIQWALKFSACTSTVSVPTRALQCPCP